MNRQKSRQKICILPKLNDCGGDAKKQWFVFFSYRNPANNNMVRFRLYDGFTQCRSKKAKYAHAEKVIADYTFRLKSGWNPFVDDLKAVYDDSLQYAAVSRVFKSARGNNKTVNYFVNQFLPEIEGMSTKTYDNYVSKYRMMNNWLTKEGYGSNDISTISPHIMQQFFFYLINDKKYARITVKKYQHMIERFFTWCVKKKHIRISPMVDIPETRRINDTAPRPINEGDINKLVKEIRDNDRQLWLTVQLEYYCFLRPGLEIRFARVGWFDLARGVINIPREVVKTKENKVVIIPDPFRENLLNEWKLHLFPQHYYIIGKNGMPGPDPLGSNNLRNRFNIIRDRMELPTTYKLYSWKHTGNVRSADAGIPAYHRQQQNGHASMRSLEEYLKNKIGFTSLELQKNFPELS